MPLLELRKLRREFPAGDQSIAVLKDVDLSIEAGEMVAIVGASGSGKSTLMNILGCLDRPTRGAYLVAGRDTATLDADELAQLRREHFGFIFQRYHLLSDLTALGNVEVPAVYAGTSRAARRDRAAALLDRLGLAERRGHRPSQLSGGQQQRVSIARALMNGGQVILADEPTGALDTQTGQEVLRILEELNAAGHTVVIVTHDMEVARHARRIIEIRDGEIHADRTSAPSLEGSEGGQDPGTGPDDGRAGAAASPPERAEASPAGRPDAGLRAWTDRAGEALRMATLAMRSHPLRTGLTMLGIIIGIAAVVSVVALGEGSRQKILQDISAIGTNTIDVYPGRDFGDEKAASIRSLVPADADALARQPYVDSVTPGVTSSSTLRYRNVSRAATVNGVGEQFFRVKGMRLASGVAFDAAAVQRRSQEVVIDENTRAALFPHGEEPIGKIILLANMPARIIGVAERQDGMFSGSRDTLNVWVPYTTAASRLLGQQHLRSITVRVSDAVPTAVAEQRIVELLTQRHGTKDFFVFNTDTIRQTVESTTATMTLLVAMIALISLVVGGIGVMNIMLVSVTERTREIGVRMAVGARRSDIRQQFLIEAVLVCLLGGMLGIALSLGIGWLFDQAGTGFRMIYSGVSMVAAFVCSTLIGVLFGFLPARNASRLDPVDALARE